MNDFWRNLFEKLFGKKANLLMSLTMFLTTTEAGKKVMACLEALAVATQEALKTEEGQVVVKQIEALLEGRSVEVTDEDSKGDAHDISGEPNG